MIAWRAEMLTTAPTVEIDLEPFRAARKARPVPWAKPETMKAVRAPLTPLTVRIGEEMTGVGLDAVFRIDLCRGDDVVRSYGIAWRRKEGTLIALQCACDADRLRDDQQWTIEVGLTEGQQLGGDPVVYRAMYAHLLSGGYALKADQLFRVRSVNYALAALGLDLVTEGDDPRCRPILLQPGQSGKAWLRQIGAVLVARQVFAGIMGSDRWAPNAAALLGMPRAVLSVFGAAYRWDDASVQNERVLEADLVRRFKRWAVAAAPGTEVDEPISGLLDVVDGQIPDIALGPRVRLVVVEAKLGLTRDSIRTGLAQAREYGFHLDRSAEPAPAVLLVGEPPGFHGDPFAEYVRATAAVLNLVVITEVRGNDFKAWYRGPSWRVFRERQPGLAVALGG